MGDHKKADPVLSLDVDVMILEYLTYKATRALLDSTTPFSDGSSHDVVAAGDEHVNMVNCMQYTHLWRSYHKLTSIQPFLRSSPVYTRPSRLQRLFSSAFSYSSLSSYTLSALTTRLQRPHPPASLSSASLASRARANGETMPRPRHSTTPPYHPSSYASLAPAKRQAKTPNSAPQVRRSLHTPATRKSFLHFLTYSRSSSN